MQVLLLKDLLKEVEQSALLQIQIYVDLDGVLSDLNKGFANNPLSGGYTVDNFKNHPKFGGQEKLAQEMFWKIINSTPNFWLNLPEMPDAKKLWKFVIENFPEPAPVILTAGQGSTIKNEKIAWIRKHISPSAQVFLADAGRNKSQYAINRANPNIIHLLIDDTENTSEPKHQNCSNWEKAGENFKALHYIGLADAKIKLSEFMVANGYQLPDLSQ